MILMLFTLEMQLLSSYFIHMHKSINLKRTDRRVLLVQEAEKSEELKKQHQNKCVLSTAPLPLFLSRTATAHL